jgi:hypothetical protein
MKEIVIDISNDGEVRIETKGFKGKACLIQPEIYEREKDKFQSMMDETRSLPSVPFEKN